MSVEEIKKAIVTLKDNVAIRTELAKGALAKSEELSIKNRAQRIISFIESKK